jgi:hypothetical protein
MSVSVVEFPFDLYTDAAGKPLDAGFIYVGVANADPVVSPVAVFWDAALTIPAAQPLRTTGGYISRNGAPANFFCASDYSIRVCDKKNSQIFYVAARADVAVTDITLESGQSLIGEAGSTIDMRDGSTVKIGDNTGVGVEIELAANARIVGNVVPDTAGSQELGSATRKWFLHSTGVNLDGTIIPPTAGAADVGTDTLPIGDAVARTARVDDLTTYRTALPSSVGDYAGLAKLNARSTLLAACRQLGCSVSGYPDGNTVLLETASATKDGPYNVASLSSSSDAWGVKVRVNFLVPIPIDAKIAVTAEYHDAGELPSSVNIGFPVIVERTTGYVSIRMVPSSSSFGVLFPFSLEVWGTPSATGATGIVSPIL